VDGTDHHSAYLAKTVAALTPQGHARVDELLAGLAGAVRDHEWLVRFAKARQAEADRGALDRAADAAPEHMLSGEELDRLAVGFITIRDQERLDDVADWANAVLALLEDEARSRHV
jgi:hypothetical protein